MLSAIALSLAAVAVAAPLSGVPSAGSMPSTGGMPSFGGSGSSSGYSSGNYGGGRKSQGTQYTTNFDDIDVGALAVTGQLLGNGDIGQFNGLDFRGFTVANLGIGTDLVTGVEPSSPPNVAAYGGTIQTLLGAVTGPEEPPVITTQFTGSAANLFDLKSFYFGCVTPGTFIADLPAGCQVTVRAYRNAAMVGEQTFNFVPSQGDTRADMVKARLDEDFIGIDTVRFSTDGDSLLLPIVGTVATLIDDVTYSVYPANQYQGGYQGGNHGNMNEWESQPSSSHSSSHSSGW